MTISINGPILCGIKGQGEWNVYEQQIEELKWTNSLLIYICFWWLHTL